MCPDGTRRCLHSALEEKAAERAEVEMVVAVMVEEMEAVVTAEGETVVDSEVARGAAVREPRISFPPELGSTCQCS